MTFVYKKNIALIFSVIVTLSAISGCLSETRDLERSTNTINVYIPPNVGRQENSNELFDISQCDQNLVFCVKSNEEWHEALLLEPQVIVFEPGKYDLGLSEITFSVEIYSSSLWEAEINTGSYINVLASDVRVSGFKFNEGGSPSGGLFSVERYGALLLSGSNIKIDNNYFNSIGVGSTVKDRTGITIHVIDSENIEIKNNIFIASQSIAVKTSDSSKRISVLNNDFLDSYNFGGAGEVFHIGDALSISQGVAPNEDSTFSSFTNNFIRNWNLEKELISIKANDNLIEGNVIVDSKDSAVVVRMGNSNIIRKNIIVGNIDFPFRISGEQNQFQENLACGSGVTVSLHNEMVYREQSQNLYNSYWAANNNIFSNNTFAGYSSIGVIDDGYAADDDFYNSSPFGNHFTNNLFYYDGEFELELTGVTNESNRIENIRTECEVVLD